MTCMQCGKEALGRSRYCSDSCKTVYNRNKNRNTSNRNTETVTPLFREGSLAHYYAEPDKYILRSSPERLNWDEWLGMDELDDFVANRVSIPGDYDY